MVRIHSGLPFKSAPHFLPVISNLCCCYGCAQPRINVMVAECLFKRGERWLPGAVTGSNVFDLEPIMQGGNSPLDVRIRRNNEMKAASNQVNALTDRSCSFNDVVNAGMRTTNHDDHTVRRIDSERQLTYFQRSRFIGHQCDQMDIGSHLDILVDQLKISSGPSRSESHHFRRRSVVVALFFRESGVLTIKTAR